MTDDRELDAMRSAWSAQPTGENVMSAEEARRAAQAFRRGIGRRNLIEYVAGVVVIAAFGYFAATDPLPLARAGALLVIAGALYTAWQMHRRAGAGAPLLAAGQSCLAFHRRQLERQRDALRGVWRWYTGPIVPGLLLYEIGLVPRIGIASAAIAIAFAGLVFGVVTALNWNAARALQQEIDRLPAD